MNREQTAHLPVAFDGNEERRRSPRLRRALPVIGGGIGVFALMLTVFSLVRSERAPVAPPSLEIALTQAAARLDAQAPLRKNATTTMIGVAAEGRRLIAEFRISEDIPTADLEAAASRLQAADAQELCGQADTRGMIGRGVGFERRYSDSNGDAFRTRTDSCGGEEGDEKASLPMAM